MYLVPNMKHVKQTKRMACWFASAQMLITWRRETTQSCEIGILDPSEDTASYKMWEINNGILNPEILKFAKRVGLQAVPPVSPSEQGLADLLFYYGPLWVNGKSHIVVIAGIRNEGSNNAEALVYDPAYNEWEVKAKEWRSLSEWYVGTNVDSRDTGGDVEAVFLHCPGY